MSTYPYITVGGVRLDDLDGRWGMDKSHPPRGLPGKRSTSVVLPGRSGVLRPSYVEPFEPGTMSFTLLVAGYGATTDDRVLDLESNLDLLKWTFTQDSLDIIYYASATKRYRVTGRYLTADVAYYLDGDVTSAKMTVAVELPDPRWRGVADGIQSLGSFSGAAMDLTILAGSTTYVNDMAFLLAGPFDNFTIRDRASQQYMAYRTKVFTGRTLVVYPALFLARLKNTWDDWSYGGSDVLADVSGDIINGGANSSTSWLNLNPMFTEGDPSYRPVQIQISMNGTTAATQVKIKGRAAYL